MNAFCPSGYTLAPQAIITARRAWFAERMAALEASDAENAGAATLAQAPSRPPQRRVPDAVWRELVDITTQTVHRLRDLLHRGRLKAYYFRADGPYRVRAAFWATPSADDVLETGRYWPLGRPTAQLSRRPSPLFLRQTELDALLTDTGGDAVAKKRPLPAAKMPDLVAALREMDRLSTRKDQHRALSELPQFQQYRITDRIFREATKLAPRSPGVKPRRG